MDIFGSEAIRRLEESWDEVKPMHPKVRHELNKMFSLARKEVVEIEPAEIKITRFNFSGVDYVYYPFGDVISGASISNVIYIDRSYLDMYNENRGKSKLRKLTLADYVLHRVSCAEGLRTINYISEYHRGMLGDYYIDLESENTLASFVAYTALKKLSRPTICIDKDVAELLSDKSKLEDRLRNPQGLDWDLHNFKKQKRLAGMAAEG
jgi:hypothetical protein